MRPNPFRSTETPELTLETCVLEGFPFVVLVERDPLWARRRVEALLQACGGKDRPQLIWSRTRGFTVKGIGGAAHGLPTLDVTAGRPADAFQDLVQLERWLGAHGTGAGDGPGPLVYLSDVVPDLVRPEVCAVLLDVMRAGLDRHVTLLLDSREVLPPSHSLHAIAVQVEDASEDRYHGCVKWLLDHLVGVDLEQAPRIRVELAGLSLSHADAVVRLAESSLRGGGAPGAEAVLNTVREARVALEASGVRRAGAERGSVAMESRMEE